MKAAIVDKPGSIVVVDIPQPAVGPYDCLVEVLYGATCTGTDLHIINNTFPWPIKYPTILGHESVGRVIEVGPKVHNLRLGDVVTRVSTPPVGQFDVNWGGFAQYAIARDHFAMAADGLPAEQWTPYRTTRVLPPCIDPAGATMIITWRETLSYLMKMGAVAGQSMLVLGSGGNGLSFVAHAANRGSTAVAMVGSQSRAASAKAVGATHFYSYSDTGWLDRAAAEHAQGFDFIVDAVGKEGMANQALPLLADGGTIGIYGLDNYGKCLLDPLRARGSFRVNSLAYDEAQAHDAIIQDVLMGKLKASNWMDLSHPYDLKDIAAAYQALASRKAIKSLVRVKT